MIVKPITPLTIMKYLYRYRYSYIYYHQQTDNNSLSFSFVCLGAREVTVFGARILHLFDEVSSSVY